MSKISEKRAFVPRTGATERFYSVYGLSLQSQIQLPLPPIDEPRADHIVLPVCRLSGLPRHRSWQGHELVYLSPLADFDSGEPARLYRFGPGLLLRYAPLADFYLWPDQIVCHALPSVSEGFLAARLLGGVLACWLELQGLPALHSSAVAHDGRAIAFLAGRQAGKSSLAAAMMQRGWALLSDDLLPVAEAQPDSSEPRCLARPGFAGMRMWPETVEKMLGRSAEGLERVHPASEKRRVAIGEDHDFGTFCGVPCRLEAIFLPERMDGEQAQVEIVPMPAATAVIELVRQSFLARIVEALGLTAARFERLARVVAAVPVWRLRYPRGYDRLPQVVDAVQCCCSGSVLPGEG